MVVVTVVVLATVLLSGVVLTSKGIQNPPITPTPSTGNTLVAYNPYDLGGQWYKGQLHSHSILSDGTMSPDDVVARYAELGYDFVALTDHKIIAQAKGSILVIGSDNGKGSAESSPIPHITALNISTVPQEDLGFEQRYAYILDQGGFAMLNHPASSGVRIGNELLDTLPNYTALELLSYENSSYTIAQWDDLLTKGKIIWGATTDDSHEIQNMGLKWVVVRMNGELTTDNVLNALRHGSFYSSRGPNINDISVSNNVIKVTAQGADRIAFYGSEGKLLKEVWGNEEVSYSIIGTEGYVRAEVTDKGIKAWTEPVFIKKADNGTTGVQAATLELMARLDPSRPLPAA
jgi:hypothetical protein